MEFNINRLTHLIKKDFLEIILKSIGIVALIFFVITTINLVIASFQDINDYHNFDIFGTWLSVFFISCAIIGAISYEEINKRPTRIGFLNIPASALEKTVSKIVNTSIIFPILMFISYYLIYGYAKLFNSFMTKPMHLNNQPDLQQYILLTVGLIIISFFAYGSIKYNTSSFPKIIIWGFALLALFGIIMFVYAFITMPELRAQIFGTEGGFENTHTTANPEDHWIIKLCTKLFYFVPLIFWTLSYFTLKEKEA